MYRPGDIIIVPFPHTDLSSVKKRPALILSSTAYNKLGDDIIVCGITSNPYSRKYSIPISRTDIMRGLLPGDSRIKPDKIFALDKKIIRKKVASVRPYILKRTYATLRTILQ